MAVVLGCKKDPSNKQNTLRMEEKRLLSTISREKSNHLLRMDMEPNYYAEEVIGHTNHFLRILVFDVLVFFLDIFECLFSLRLFGTSPTEAKIHCNGQFLRSYVGPFLGL